MPMSRRRCLRDFNSLCFFIREVENLGGGGRMEKCEAGKCKGKA